MTSVSELQSESNGVPLTTDKVSALSLSCLENSAMATFRSAACFSSSLLTFFLVTNGALSVIQPQSNESPATADSLESHPTLRPEVELHPATEAELLLPAEPEVALPSAHPTPAATVPDSTQSPSNEGVHPSIVIPEMDPEALEGAIVADAGKLEWARQKLLGRQLEESLANEHAEAIAADAEADKAEEEEDAKTAETDATNVNTATLSEGAPRWVATSMPLSVTFPDFSIQDFLNLPLRLPGNGDISALFPLPIPASISSLFGWRQHPIFGEWRLHQGVDLAAPEGTPVLAAFSGRVKTADYLGGYGITVILEHSDGTQETLYAHLSQILVEPGDWIEQGSAIGRVGSTGNSTGPHLHFELRQLTDQGWVALDVNGLMQQALAEFGELPVAILDVDPNAPRSLKNPKKLDEFGKLAGRVAKPRNASHQGSEGIFRGV